MLKYFCAYFDMLDGIKRLTDAQAGKLFRALLVYAETGQQPQDFNGALATVFDIYAAQIDRDKDKYQKRCEKNRDNISKRYERIRTNTNATNVYERYQEKEKDKYKEKYKEKDNIGGLPPKSPKPATRFIAPTIDEITSYAQERGHTDRTECERFRDYYESNGWKVGKNPMKDWRAALRGWFSRNKAQGTTKQTTNPALNYEQRDNDYYEHYFDNYGGDF